MDPVSEPSPLSHWRTVVILGVTLAVSLAGIMGYFVGTEVTKRRELTGTEPPPNIGEPPQPLSGSTWMMVTVDSTKPGWQNTSLQFQKNDQVVVVYINGKWTVDSNSNFPYVGPDGYSPGIGDKMDPECKVDPNQPHGALLAKTSGTYQAKPVGSEGERFLALADGTLQLRINDKDGCLRNSKGSIIVFVAR